MMQETSTNHIAALAFPFGTHAPPLLNLARRITSSNPDVKVSFFSTAQSNESLFKGDDDGDVKKSVTPYNVHDGLPENYVFKGNRLELLGYFLTAASGNFWKAMDQAETETGLKITCLITDAFLSFGADMAEEMGGIPWIALWTSGPRPLLLSIVADDIIEHLAPQESKDESKKPSGLVKRIREYISGPAENTLDFLPGFSKIRDIDLPDGLLKSNHEDGVEKMLNNMGKTLPRATAVLANNFEELDPIIIDSLKSKLRNFLSIGPFLLTCPPSEKTKDKTSLDWLDKQNPASVAYVSFGSVAQPPLQEIVALAEALEASKTPFLWSFRGNPDEILPQGFLERIGDIGQVVPWAPQLEVLLHSSVGVFITHCGWNSVLESINGGVPLICRPFFGDQLLNRRVIEVVWETGLGVEGGQFTKDATIKALTRIMSSDEGKKMKDKILEFKELSLNAVLHDGSSTKNFITLLEIITK